MHQYIGVENKQSLAGNVFLFHALTTMVKKYGRYAS